MKVIIISTLRHERAEWIVTDKRIKTERGWAGFGHTGKY